VLSYVYEKKVPWVFKTKIMIQKSSKSIFSILESLPKEALVLDVGGASSPFKRANFIIDVVSYDQINWEQAKGPGEICFNKDSFVQYDICSRTPWPFKDKQFDYSTCSHVLEDIRDPLWVCSELIRVSKSGYIEIPSRQYETTFGLEMAGLAGAAHHRWIVDLDKKESLRFTFKYMYVHSKDVNKNSGTYNKSDETMYLKLAWNDTFSFFENWLNSGKEIMEFYLDKKLTEKEVWMLIRKTNPRNSLIRWLSYLKNTNPFFQKLFSYSKKYFLK